MMITIAGGVLLALVILLMLPFLLPLFGLLLRLVWYGALILVAIVLVNSW